MPKVRFRLKPENPVSVIHWLVIQSASSKNTNLVKPDFGITMQSSIGKWQCTVCSKERRYDCVNIAFLLVGWYLQLCLLFHAVNKRHWKSTGVRAGRLGMGCCDAATTPSLSTFELSSSPQVWQTDHQTDTDIRVEIRHSGCRLNMILLKTRCVFCNGQVCLLACWLASPNKTEMCVHSMARDTWQMKNRESTQIIVPI